MKPFRWNLLETSQLGSLLDGQSAEAYRGYFKDLKAVAPRLVARAQGHRLVFVGRSPENFFDYLSGVFETTPYAQDIELLNISNRFQEISEIKNQHPALYEALKVHFLSLGLSPQQIIQTKQGVCFCDLVARGGTFGQLLAFIKFWTEDEKEDFPALLHKILFLGLTFRTKTSPNTRRWQAHAEWVKTHPQARIINLSIPGRLWDYLGNWQDKVSLSNPPYFWGSEHLLHPPRYQRNLQALRQAYALVQHGRQDKLDFAGRLAQTPEVKTPFVRHMIQTLKGYSG